METVFLTFAGFYQERVDASLCSACKIEGGLEEGVFGISGEATINFLRLLMWDQNVHQKWYEIGRFHIKRKKALEIRG